MHYILLREFLRPWALKFGALDPHWQEDLFTDLVGRDAKQLRYNLIKDGEIEVVGRRFWVRAVEDDKRDDTLFVVEVGPAGRKEAKQTFESKWLLAKGNRWEVKGNPIRLGGLKPPISTGTFGTFGSLVGNLALGRTFDVALKALVVPWTADWLKAVPPLGPLDADAALARLSQRYQQHPDLFGHLAGNAREGQILLQKVSRPVDALQIAESFIARVGLAWLEKVHGSMPSKLAEAVGFILGLPSHPDVLRRLIRLWLAEASAADFPGHLAATVEWLDAAHESVKRERWIHLLKDIHAHRVKTRGIPMVNGSANIGSALTSWDALRQWAKAERQARAASPIESPPPPEAAAAAKEAVNAVTEVAHQADSAEASWKAEEAEEVPQTPAVSAPPPAEATPVDQREELMRRLAALRHQGVLAARPNLFSAAKEISQHAENLAGILHGLPGSEALRKAREALDAITRAATGATFKLPTYDEVHAGDLELATSAQILMKLISTGPAPWVQTLGSWSELQELIRVLGSPALDQLPAWLYQDLAPEEADPTQARIRAASGATRGELRDVLEWIEGLPVPDANLLVQTNRAEGPDPLGRLRRALETRKNEQLLQGRLAPLEAQHGPWVRQLFDHAYADMTVADAANSVEILVQQFETVALEAPALRAELVSRLGMMASLREAHDFVQRLEKELKLLGPATVEHLKTVDAVHAVAVRLGPASAKPAVPAVHQAVVLEIDHCVSGERASRRRGSSRARTRPQTACTSQTFL